MRDVLRIIVSLKISAILLQSKENPHKRSISSSFHRNNANRHSFRSCADIMTIVKRALSHFKGRGHLEP
jgi:hypothetical protein